VESLCEVWKLWIRIAQMATYSQTNESNFFKSTKATIDHEPKVPLRYKTERLCNQRP